MIKLKSEAEIKIMREGGKRLATILNNVASHSRPGVSAKALDDLAYKLIKEGGDEPSFLNYTPPGGRHKFPASLCVSINDTIVHGIPTEDKILKTGDTVGLDLGLKHKGFFLDSAITIVVGLESDESDRLLAVTREALIAGIKAARPGKPLGAVSTAIEQVVGAAGYGLVRELGGHGVGYKVHEEPEVPNYGGEKDGPIMKPGLVIAIEPMVNEGGKDEVIFLDDGFTVKTSDGSRSAHFEHTVAITETGAEILTRLN